MGLYLRAPRTTLGPAHKHVFRAFQLGDDELAAKRRCNRDDPALAVIGRGWEYIVKTAMIRAIGRCPAKPVITEADVAWAARLVRHCQASLLAGIEEHVADNKAEETYRSS